MTSDPQNNSVFWSGGIQYYQGEVDTFWAMVVSKTTNGGSDWTRYTLCTSSSMNVQTNVIAVDPSNSDVVYAGGFDDNGAALYKTPDSGANWSDVSAGISDTIFDLAVNPVNTSVVYAGSSDGVFKTLDGGASWVNMGLSDVRAIVIDPDAPNIINAATKTGAYISFSGGTEWEAMNDGLENQYLRCMGLNPDTYLYAGTWGDGVCRCVPEYDDVWPPAAPLLTRVEKSGDDALLTWRAITTDTLENPDSIDHYVIYRSTSPSFVPGPSDSIGVVSHPDTTFIDVDVLAAAQTYYYLAKAVDEVANRSKNSNMGYVFHKVLNENEATTDRNWMSLPWDNNYATVSALTADVSAAGDPLVKVTNLRDDQKYESWLWDPDFGEWYGTDFAIASGRGYEMVTICDTTIVLVGCNDPVGLVSLNENPATTDRNWVSIPYNHVYSTVSDITTEYSPLGEPLVKVTNLRDDQKYESWLWDPDFGEWYGTDFAIASGRGYEMVTIVDTMWNPTEYSNESGLLFVRQNRQTDVRVRLGTALTKDRAPVWVEDKKINVDGQRAKCIEQSAEGLSHIVRLHVAMKDFENLVFTAYCPDNPYDVVTENMVGSGSAEKQGSASLWFDVGNFEESWVSGDELLVIVEATKQGRGYYTVVSVVLDKTVDVQDLGKITLVPLSDLNLDDTNIIGYSVYKDDRRLNACVLTAKNYRIDDNAVIRPVFRGGYETVYGSREPYERPAIQMPQTYAMNVHPNPSVKATIIEYALPEKTRVDLVVYDITGRRVVSVAYGLHAPGYYSVVWDGCDEQGRNVAAGIYFIRLQAGEFVMQHKVLVIK